MTMQLNKVHAVTTIDLVARELAKTADHLLDVAQGMEPEDGLIWVYSGNHEHGIMAFTEDGIEHLRNLIEEKQLAKN